MRKQLAAVLAAAALALAACSGAQPPADPPSIESTAAPASAAPSASGSASPSATPSAVPVEECLSGDYRLTRFVGLGGTTTYGTGEGGDVTFSFGKDSYVMTGAGKKPILVTLAAQQGELLVDGTVRGTFTTTDRQGAFTVGRTTGSATIRSGGQKQTFTMAQVARVLAPQGAAVLNCASTTLQIVSGDTRLDLER